LTTPSSTRPRARASSRDRVFEPFYSSGAIQGSGLGLAIAHELAGRMGGSLDVGSSPGETVFTLTLLAAEPLAAELAKAER
jgi:signal transduction histidine kinase